MLPLVEQTPASMESQHKWTSGSNCDNKIINLHREVLSKFDYWACGSFNLREMAIMMWPQATLWINLMGHWLIFCWSQMRSTKLLEFLLHARTRPWNIGFLTQAPKLSDTAISDLSFFWALTNWRISYSPSSLDFHARIWCKKEWYGWVPDFAVLPWQYFMEYLWWKWLCNLAHLDASNALQRRIMTRTHGGHWLCNCYCSFCKRWWKVMRRCSWGRRLYKWGQGETTCATVSTRSLACSDYNDCLQQKAFNSTSMMYNLLIANYCQYLYNWYLNTLL